MDRELERRTNKRYTARRLKIREIRTADELEGLSASWDDLLGRRGEFAIHSSFQWVSTWWKHLAKGKELFVLAAQEGNEIVGLAPLFLSEFRRKKLVRFRRVYFLGEGLSDYGCFLTRSGSESVWREFLTYLADSSAWHELRLQNIPLGGDEFDRLCRLGNDLGYSIDSQERKPTHCFYVDATGDFKDYVKTTSRDVKKDVPRRLNMIEDAGGYELKFTGEVSVDELLTAMADIHTKRQSELGRESFFQHTNEREFIDEITKLYHKRGWLDYIVMRIDGRIAAYMLGFRYGGVRYSWNVGFDPRYNELSLGKVLAYLWIEDAFRRKEINEFNFMRGDSEFKRKFTDKYRWNHHLIARHPRSLYVKGVGLAEKVFGRRN